VRTQHIEMTCGCRQRLSSVIRQQPAGFIEPCLPVLGQHRAGGAAMGLSPVRPSVGGALLLSSALVMFLAGVRYDSHQKPKHWVAR
jgi:hypothetical protein